MGRTSLDGDVPCADCGTEENLEWFTENVFWNHVCPDESPILCIPCFAKRAEAVGYRPMSWRLLPEWNWEGELSEEHKQKIRARHDAWLKGEDELEDHRAGWRTAEGIVP